MNNTFTKLGVAMMMLWMVSDKLHFLLDSVMIITSIMISINVIVTTVIEAIKIHKERQQ